MLYTRKGDRGTTKTLATQERISKASPLPEALGTLDELNAYIGLCRAVIAERNPHGHIRVGGKKKTVIAILKDVQEKLFIVQAHVAGANKKITSPMVKGLEAGTDSIEKSLPPITTFSIPGQSYVSAHLDVARTISRRAERTVVKVHEEAQPIHEHTLAYLNRLSSLLFALVRHANQVAEAQEAAPTYK